MRCFDDINKYHPIDAYVDNTARYSAQLFRRTLSRRVIFHELVCPRLIPRTGELLWAKNMYIQQRMPCILKMAHVLTFTESVIAVYRRI